MIKINMPRRCFLGLAAVAFLGGSAGAQADFSQKLPQAEDFGKIVATAGELHQYDIVTVLRGGCSSISAYPSAVGCYSAGIAEINDAQLNTVKGICGEIGGVSGRTCYEKAIKMLASPIFVDAAKVKRVVLAMCADRSFTSCFFSALTSASGKFESIAKKCDGEYWVVPSKTACYKTSLGD